MFVLQGLYKFHQYQVVGRHLPTKADENPQIYRMKLWALDAVRAKSKFWCVLSTILLCSLMNCADASAHLVCDFAASTQLGHTTSSLLTTSSSTISDFRLSSNSTPLHNQNADHQLVHTCLLMQVLLEEAS